MDYYREAEINRFATIGFVTVAVIGASFWGLRTYVQQGLEQDRLEAPWVVAARQQKGLGHSRVAIAGTPAASQETQEAIARWRRESAQ
jgi:hypothetical protein